jgi:hypothetical protein
MRAASQLEVVPPRMPRPMRAALPWLALALASLAVAALGVRARDCLAVAAGSVLVAVVRVLLELRDLWALRRAADAVLRTGARVHPYSALLVWRAGELTSDRNRRILARSFRNIVRELERPSLMSAVPLNRAQAWEHVSLLAELSERLGDLDSAIRPQGVVLVEDLLTDGVNSPLFGRGHSPLDGAGDSRPALGPVLADCLAALRPTASSRTVAAKLSPDTTPDVYDPDGPELGRVSAHGGGNR